MRRKGENMKRFAGIFTGICLILLLWIGSAGATQLIWTPVNPSFGGFPSNGQYLLDEANAQNHFEEKYEQPSVLDSFQESLARAILTQLSSKIVEKAFGTNGEFTGGHYEVGGQIIDVNTSGSSITVNVTDTLTGGSTTIKVPYY